MSAGLHKLRKLRVWSAAAAKPDTPQRKQLEFMQRLALLTTIFSLAIVAATLAGNFVLLWFGRQPMPQETITTVTVYGGISSTATTACYAALTGVRNISANNTGLTKPEDLGGDEGNG